MTTKVIDKEFTNLPVKVGEWIEFMGGDVALVVGVNEIFTRYILFSTKYHSISTITREHDGSLASSEPYRLLDVAVHVLGTKRSSEG